jgi:hypothetical protein
VSKPQTRTGTHARSSLLHVAPPLDDVGLDPVLSVGTLARHTLTQLSAAHTRHAARQEACPPVSCVRSHALLVAMSCMSAAPAAALSKRNPVRLWHLVRVIHRGAKLVRVVSLRGLAPSICSTGCFRGGRDPLRA